MVTHANLTFQWQRELNDKFRATFEIVRGEALQANYGMNPRQEKSQVITSASRVSRFEGARDNAPQEILLLQTAAGLRE